MRSLLCALSFLTAVFCNAQTITPEQRQEANSYYSSNDWPNTIKAYSAILKAEPQNWNAKMRIGVAMTNSGKVKEAIPLLEEAVKIGNNGMTMYYLGSAYARDGDKDKAFEWVNKSLTNGFALLTVFETDTGFNSVKTDSRYASTYNQMKRSVYPCQYLSEAHQFDFWLGEWDVRSTTNQPAGKSKIERLLNDCVILENWTSAPPNLYAGKSFNLYNGATKKWMQTWVDDKGGVLEFIDGEYKDNKMVFVTRPDTQNQITRLTFYNMNPNLVRQLFEVTKDNGKTWATTTDLYYNRVN